MHIIFHALLIVAIFTFSIHCQGGEGNDYGSGNYDSGSYSSGDDDSDIIYLLYAICYLLVVISDNEIIVLLWNKFVKILNENYIVIVSLICTTSLAIYIIVLIRNWVLSNDTSHPSNVTFVNEVDSISNKANAESSNSLFPSGQWISRYFQYKKWHGSHLFSLSFNHEQQKVTGSGKDDIGEFSIDGIYSFNTRRIGLTKKYQKGTGNSSQNLEHTVIIQLKWDSQKQLFHGKWYVKTKKYQGEDKFELQFDQSTIVVDKQ
ncbi:unnamed protein product [Adineta steineri]|uniref:Transmembrane protein n=1 Tax=Adineta steineri TaxID=433720 RepID=A0A819MGD4_9BILA|nr:unnamed protein product [Adineta steineri]CAF3979147.1 unnamed protein product [Adineta steineri]